MSKWHGVLRIQVATIREIRSEIRSLGLDPTEERIEKAVAWVTANAQVGVRNALDDLGPFFLGQFLPEDADAEYSERIIAEYRQRLEVDV